MNGSERAGQFFTHLLILLSALAVVVPAIFIHPFIRCADGLSWLLKSQGDLVSRNWGCIFIKWQFDPEEGNSGRIYIFGYTSLLSKS